MLPPRPACWPALVVVAVVVRRRLFACLLRPHPRGRRAAAVTRRAEQRSGADAYSRSGAGEGRARVSSVQTTTRWCGINKYIVYY